MRGDFSDPGAPFGAQSVSTTPTQSQQPLLPPTPPHPKAHPPTPPHPNAPAPKDAADWLTAAAQQLAAGRAAVPLDRKDPCRVAAPPASSYGPEMAGNGCSWHAHRDGGVAELKAMIESIRQENVAIKRALEHCGVKVMGENGTSSVRASSFNAGGHKEFFSLVPAQAQDSVPPGAIDLPDSLWSLHLVAAAGEFKFADGRDVNWPLTFATLLASFIGFIQSFTVFLIVHDLNPEASPTTTEPGAEWLHKAWTVNAMKFLMIFFVTAVLQTEAVQCVEIINAAWKVPYNQLLRPRWEVLFIPLFQYLILIGVVWGGVAVVLSCQAVPDILYNSLAITFIVNTDELCYTLIMKLFDLQTNLMIEFDDDSKFSRAGPPEFTPMSEKAVTEDEVLSERSPSERAAAFGKAHPYASELRLHGNRPWQTHPFLPLQQGHTHSRTWSNEEDDDSSGGEAFDFVQAKKRWLHAASKVFIIFPMAFGFAVASRACWTGTMPTAGLGLHHI